MINSYVKTLTPKQKAKLKGLANGISQRYLLGKADLDENFLVTVDKALEAKELIKVGILQNSDQEKEELCDLLKKRLDCEIVQLLGRVITIYRPSKKDPKIVLPK